jgi:hypothetical protein
MVMFTINFNTSRIHVHLEFEDLEFFDIFYL